ncbi:hypothetical protein [Stackebrandtia soli]|uniref:hypothetical protein n=1 Tax=Stackebrandtia soli TaxID=1892856 RepID=UPI0039EA66AB
MMLQILGDVECSGAIAEADPWIPLTVLWQISWRGGPLYLSIHGDDGGYVALKVDPDSGALYSLVVSGLPPESDRPIDDAPTVPGSWSPVFDVNMWEWKVTPDYREPSQFHIDATSPLYHSAPGDLLAVWFSDSPVSRYLACGEVRVGVSSIDELVSVVVRRPPVTMPELLPGVSLFHPGVDPLDYNGSRVSDV